MKKLCFLVILLTAFQLMSAQSDKSDPSPKKEIKKKIIVIKEDDEDSPSQGKEEDKEIIILNKEEDFPRFNRELRIAEGKQNKAVLGVQISDVIGNNGAGITKVLDKSGAKEAGILDGDIILSVDDKKVGNMEELIESLSGFSPGEKVKVRLLRSGEIIKKTVQLKKPSEVQQLGCMANPKCKVFKDIKLSEGEEEELLNLAKDQKRKKIIVTEESETASHESNRNLSVNLLYGSPNPTQGVLTIHFKGDKQPFTIKVTDLNGKDIYSESVEDNSGSYQKEISVEKVSGTILIQVKQGDKMSTAKVIVE